MTNDSSVALKDITSTQPVDWFKIPISDVLSLTPGTLQEKEFANLHNCSERMKGRALGRISNLRVALFAPPDVIVTLAVCLAPSSAGGSSAPASIPQILAYQGSILHAGPHLVTGPSPLALPIGVRDVLKGASTTILVGHAPHIYAFAKAVKLSDHKASTETCYLQLMYDLELSGYDHLKPF